MSANDGGVMNCTCFDLTLEQAANGGLMQAAVNCTHKGVMSLEDKIVEAVLGRPLKPGVPMPNFVNKILQAITDAGWNPPLTDENMQRIIDRMEEHGKASKL